MGSYLVLSGAEVCGVGDRKWGQIRGFREVVQKFGLIDLGIRRGGQFTCYNRRISGHCRGLGWVGVLGNWVGRDSFHVLISLCSMHVI